MSSRRFLFLPFLVLAMCSAGGQDSGTLEITKSCTGAHSIDFDLNVGDAKILPSAEADHVRLIVRSNRREDDGAMNGWVERFDIADGVMHVVVKLPKGRTNYGNSGVTMYIPAQTTLRAHLGVGDMLVGGIRGDKTIDVGVGDLTISALNADEYGEVRANTRIGDVSDALHGAKVTGWLGKSEKVTTVGKYKLQAHVGIGDLKIEKEGDTP